MKHFLFCFSILTIALLTLTTSCTQKKSLPPPNIVWLVSEDNSPYIGVYGDTLAHTPNIDKLAESGVVYDNAFANAPVCAPARNTIITGMYANSTGESSNALALQSTRICKIFP